MLSIYSYPKNKKKIAKKFDFSPTNDFETRRTVEKIISKVQNKGDEALFKYTKKFDKINLTSKTVRVTAEECENAFNSLPANVRGALRKAKKRITDFHKHQKRDSWTITDKEGFRLSQRWMPLESAGLYAPGGIASYPSSVLMDAVPAKVAGVEKIVAVTPPEKGGLPNATTLGACHIAGVDEVYQIGGAQAVAALAYGTESVPKVDIIVGPGNRFVAEAKRLLYGQVKIDMVAGPSEVMIVADKNAPIEWIAADMLAQAEHDPVASSIAILINRDDAKELKKEVQRQVETAPRREVLEKSLPEYGMIINVETEEEALELVNQKAPEHLELLMRSARSFSTKVKHAGSIFVGNYAVEAIGDYIAGPNHVLPTGGSARRFSALSVQDFLKMTQVIECTKKGLEAVGRQAAVIADREGLDAHAQSIRMRLKSNGRKKAS